MNEKTFQELVKSMVAEELEEHVRKSEDYADPERTGDVLDNFKAGAKEVDTTPIKYLLIHMNKHIRAIYRYSRSGKTASEDIKGRIKDTRNYLALLRALIEDEKQKTLTTTKTVKSNGIICPSCHIRMFFIGTPQIVYCRCCGRDSRITYREGHIPTAKLISEEKSK